jgi:hypothetical protein
VRSCSTPWQSWTRYFPAFSVVRPPHCACQEAGAVPAMLHSSEGAPLSLHTNLSKFLISGCWLSCIPEPRLKISLGDCHGWPCEEPAIQKTGSNFELTGPIDAYNSHLHRYSYSFSSDIEEPSAILNGTNPCGAEQSFQLRS